MTTILATTAPAKVNLDLAVTGRRADGYHLLDSLVVFVDIADEVSLRTGTGPALTAEGPFAGLLPAEPAHNLALRALVALAGALERPADVALHLVKHLPAAAGLGGGSADAAAVLRLAARAWDARGIDLPALALSLGADVPVCLEGRPVRMRGVGEILDPLPCTLPEAWLVLVNPGIPLETAPVFRARSGGFSPVAPDLPARLPDVAALADGLRPRRNDLEAAAISLCPAIGDVLAALGRQPGCLLARMSGSGASGFGLFATKPDAEAALPGLRRQGWWAQAGRILSDPPAILSRQIPAGASADPAAG